MEQKELNKVSAISKLEEKLMTAQKELEAVQNKRKAAAKNKPKTPLTLEQKKADLLARQELADKELKLKIEVLQLSGKIERLALFNQTKTIESKVKGTERKDRDHAMYLLAGEMMASFQNTDMLKKLQSKVADKDKKKIQLLIDEVERRFAKKDAHSVPVANANAPAHVNTQPQKK